MRPNSGAAVARECLICNAVVRPRFHGKGGRGRINSAGRGSCLCIFDEAEADSGAAAAASKAGGNKRRPKRFGTVQLSSAFRRSVSSHSDQNAKVLERRHRRGIDRAVDPACSRELRGNPFFFHLVFSISISPECSSFLPRNENVPLVWGK